jgi:L-ascorbate metabolism protein UlaG (beta-lactamase superfamily)
LNLRTWRGNPRRRAWPVSDHFDGKRFFNPAAKHAPPMRTVLKMLREPRSRWPRWVENTGVPQLDSELTAGDVAITFVNHATFLIQVGGVAILTDPIWSKRASWVGPRRVRDPGVAYHALPRIDTVLLSHNHYDHFDTPTLKRLRRSFSPTVVAAAGDRPRVERLGFADVRELDWWEETSLGDVKVTFVPAQHFSARGLHDRRRSLWGGYVIESGGRLIYFGGDTGYAPHFLEIKARLGAPDIALLPIGAYEPRWFIARIHMNPAEAVRAHLDLGARHSVGMHFGTFQLTSEPIDQPQADLKLALSHSGISDRDFVTLNEGETRIWRVAAPP